MNEELSHTEIFDAVHVNVQTYRSQLAAANAVQYKADRTQGGIPAIGNRMAEYVADFQVVARQTLEQRWPKRWALFVLVYGRPRPYSQAVKELGVPKGTFDYWHAQIKRQVGRELERQGLFPLGAYFRRVRL